ncbi:MAG: endoglucanase [Planctomycetota bacterium]|nr:MAG: endoglucanase [Planctomycetota bacterium]
MRPILLALTALLWFVAPASRAGDRVTVRVYPLVGNRPVEPLAFGVNGKGFPGATLVRHGGNRLTGLNWETGASHAGEDWRNQHDWYMAEDPSLRGPGKLIESWVLSDRERGAATLISLPLAGYVAADARGPVLPADAAPSPRWERVEARRAGTPLLAPDTNDGVVYLDEQVRHLLRRFGRAQNGGVHAYALGNEPALWPHTHPRLHPKATRWNELLLRSAEVAEVVTELDPTALVFGPALYGWAAHKDLQGASDAESSRSFSEAYLDAMSQASERAGRRLLHAFDMHWYPEVTVDGERITGANTSRASSRARTQAPRSLWDPSYEEDSWVAHDAGGPITLIPRLQHLVDTEFPGTRLAISEYHFGGAQHASGGVAQVEALGSFARLGVIANYWPMGDDQSYVQAAFRMFLNDDDSGAHFGDTVVHATTSERELTVAFGAKDAQDPGRLTLILLNRSPDAALDASVLLSPGSGTITQLDAWRFDENGSDLRKLRAGPVVQGEGFDDTLPRLSATLYVLRLE